MSAIDRVVAFHIARLKDKNPEVRLRAIRELDLLGAVEAYDALETLYQNETDGAVRKAAREVGYRLFMKNRST